MSIPKIIGWDLGGVHVKAALIHEGRIVQAVQIPCPLWQGVTALDGALKALPDWARQEAVHAVTMTGELTDCFADRRAGVAALAEWAATRLAGRVRIFAGRSGFVAPDEAAGASGDIASANWYATASLVGSFVPHALLVDVGSTTADLIPIVAGCPAAAGYSDAERLETGELVYTGVVRTPLIGLADHAPFRGRRTRLMTETFAHAGDVYRILGDLPPEADQQGTGDRKGKSVAESETRLARIVGRDRGEGDAAAWTALARHFAEMQLRLLHDAAAVLLSRPDLPSDSPLVTCGAGIFLGDRLAARLGRTRRGLSDLLLARAGGDVADTASSWISTCGPAAAVGLIAENIVQ